MKIIAWNCNMKFRQKIENIIDLSPQLAIISECENIEKLKKSKHFNLIKNAIWVGENSNKGLGVFSFSDIKLTIASWYNDNFKYIIPIYVQSIKESYLLFAIWACNPRQSNYKYIEQVYQAMLFYSQYLTHKNIVIIGDFNSNTIWDKEHQKYGSHSMLVNFLQRKNIKSCYHSYFNETQGKESIPTLYMYRHIDKPYHVDYCFLSGNLFKKTKSFKVGKTNIYLQHSDHMPMSLELD